MQELLLALALAIALEGALYALFPDGMRRAIAVMMSQPTERIRIIGLTVSVLGVGLIWLIRS